VFLVNRFGRVVQVDDEELADKKIKSGRMRVASDTEIARALAGKELAASADPGSVYYSTVRQSSDGYGMSRDHVKYELAELGVKLSEQFHEQKVGLLYNYPYTILSLRNDVRLCYTMFESDKIPEDWPDLLKSAEEVIVPSKWCHDVFLKAGIPSTVVPLGYDSHTFTYVDRPVPVENNEPFVFIHYDSFNMRKGFREVFEAFRQEFDKSDNVKLILKTNREAAAIPVVKSEFPNIEVIRGALPAAELAALLGRANCMVYPSRGEGFGITPLEAMATGLPAIVPNAHGISEYFNSNYMLEVEVEGKCPALNGRFKSQDIGDMVVCSVEHLRQQMRYAFNNQAEMKELGRQAAEYAKGWTYKHTAERLKAIIEKWQKTEVIKRQDSKYLQVERV
jgi:glycosyltransferase involved in cell wall biosynthesis